MAKQQATSQLHTATAIVFIFLILLPVTIQPITATEAEETSFSVIWVSDTQYLSESRPEYFDNLCQWIVQNKDVYNVKMVVHTGDLVEDEGNRTQWLNANHSMGILLDSGVPYTWDAGNHDYNAMCWIGSQYTAFNPQIMEAKPYWVGDCFDGMNTAVRFDAAGQEWLIVNVAFYANDSALTWANGILDQNPKAHAIVATHAYLNRVGKYESWAADFKTKVLDTHANVFLTLSGHYHPTSGVRTRAGERDELLFNQQDAYNKEGAESARILTFDTAQGTIKVQTYSLLLNQFIEDSDNSFTLTTSFRNGAAERGVMMIVLAAGLAGVFCVGGLCLVAVRKRGKRKR